MKKQILLIATLLLCTSTQAHDFNWDNLMLAHSKLDPAFDYEVMVDSYMKVYRKPVWNRYKNDEFELESKRQETIEIMRKRISSFNLDEEFTIKTTFEFQMYDFKNEEFPLKKLSSNSYFHESNNKVHWSNSELGNTYSVFFDNTEIMKNLPMEKERAKLFIQNKKSSSGRINRRLPTDIKFKIIKHDNDYKLRAIITEITIHDNNDGSPIHTFK